MSSYPQRIVCLTEESAEFLYLIGESHRIIGVSAYAVRPEQIKEKPKVSAFINGHVKKIKSLNPDLIIGFSDIQKDLARDLIAEGLNVWIGNHRSIEEIIHYLEMLGRIVQAEEKSKDVIKKMKSNMDIAKEFSKSLNSKPKVYIEEWDEPLITGIKWFGELIELCGGELLFSEKSKSSLAKDRILQNDEIVKARPDIFLASWCGKKVDLNSIMNREGYSNLPCVQNKQIYELEPEIFLQPGPAPLLDGIFIIIEIFKSWQKS